jgi:pyridoxal phosphate enzyme (YggS family)
METLNSITQKIRDATQRAERKSPPVLIAVSKFQPIEKMIELYEQGQRDFGENYVQELVSKSQAFREKGLNDVRFHFIGKLQSNKVKSLLPEVYAIHSIDSIRLLREVEKRAMERAQRIEVFFQINIDEEESKAGFLSSDLPDLCEGVKDLRSVVPAGLMAIPDPSKDPVHAFERMSELSQTYGPKLGMGLSMGMSGDYEVAIQKGSTAIRIGTALFGERTN